MTKLLKIILFIAAAGLVGSCSQILQTVDLEINTQDSSVQENFNVVEKTLLIGEARKQNNAPYLRKVLRSGRGGNARSIPENFALISKLPSDRGPFDYKIGIGDILTFSRLIDNSQNSSDHDYRWPTQTGPEKYKLGIGDTLTLTLMQDDQPINQIPSSASDRNRNQNLIINSQQNDITINSTGRIGSDGSLLLLEIGRLEASGKSLSELRSEVRNIFIRNGTIPRFQLEISDFKSQKAYLSVSSSQGAASKIITLNEQRTTLLDILTSSRISFKPGLITTVKLQREDDIFYMKLRDVFTAGSPEIHILDRDRIFVEENSAEMATSLSKVDQGGNVVFAGTGKIKASGRSLDDLQNEIERILAKVPGSNNAFQLEITEFLSQTAEVITPKTLDGGSSKSIRVPITDRPTTIVEALSDRDLKFDSNNIAQINLQRNGISYAFTLDDLLDPNVSDIYLRPGDQINTHILPYKENKVFILGAVSPQIFTINPAKRETLADALFTEGGALSTTSAKRSEVYLLRGDSPVVAYHLDAQSPTRLIVADAMELRPNDILYVAEQPIMSFNRALSTIVPLRILLRDIQDDNIP